MKKICFNASSLVWSCHIHSYESYKLHYTVATLKTGVGASLLQAIQHQLLQKTLNTLCSGDIADWGWELQHYKQCSSDITDWGCKLQHYKQFSINYYKNPKYTMQQWRHRLGLKLWYYKQFSINSYGKPTCTMQQQHCRLGLELQYYKQFGIKANEKPKYTMQQRHYRLGLELQ